VAVDAPALAGLEHDLSEEIARLREGRFMPTPSERACSDCPALDLVCAGPGLRTSGGA